MMIPLPYPPTANTYYRTRVVRSSGGAFASHYISERGKAFRAEVIAACHPMIAMVGAVSVAIDVFPPDRRVRDLDNIVKPLLDALTAAGAWGDDSQVARLIVTRREIVKGGRVEVTLSEWQPGVDMVE